MVLLFVAMVAVAGAALPPLEAPPVISMSLAAKKYVSGSVEQGAVDANGIPCISHAADQASCAELAHTPHQTHYAFCVVGEADAVTCPEPEVEAHDHHDGQIPIQKKIKLFVRSDPHKAPEIADVEVAELDYNQRGEYTLIYDAMDSAGNAADTVIFHIFMIDHTAPTILPPPTTTDYHYEDGFFQLGALTATDNYDGGVSDTLQITITTPSGDSRKYNYEQAVLIDTSIIGKYGVTATAHDFSGVFGHQYQDNYMMKKGYILVTPGSVSVHFGNQDHTFVPEHHAPTPAPVQKKIIADHHHLSIPPILVLSDSDGSVITRSSPFGQHHDETTYRSHLSTLGYSESEVTDHISAIVEREIVLAQRLGEEHAWQNYQGKPIGNGRRLRGTQ